MTFYSKTKYYVKWADPLKFQLTLLLAIIIQPNKICTLDVIVENTIYITLMRKSSATLLNQVQQNYFYQFIANIPVISIILGDFNIINNELRVEHVLFSRCISFIILSSISLLFTVATFLNMITASSIFPRDINQRADSGINLTIRNTRN